MATIPTFAGSPASNREGQPARPPIKLTRRGRLVLIWIPAMLLAAVLISLAGFVNAPAKAADSSADLHPTPAVTVTVQPGDTLWSIAAATVPGRDTRDVVADIAALNHLDGGGVRPGQQLFVPKD